MSTKIAEYVSSGHPDKVADFISDSILDQVLQQDPEGHCAAETLVVGNTVIVAGEVSSKGPNLNIGEIVRQAIANLGYTRSSLGFDAFSCQIVNLLRQQSPDLARLQAVGPAVAGDQGVVTGYATSESPDYLPLPLSVARFLLNDLLSENLPGIFLDAKSLVTLDCPASDLPRFRQAGISVHSSWQAKDLQKLAPDLLDHLKREYLGYLTVPTLAKITFNPAGPFTIGGPAGDTGLTGRKIVVDQYGDEVPVGGGAFSGKDPTKVDRSGAYYARYVAKNLVASGLCKRALVKVYYMIGQDGPQTILLDTFGTNSSGMSDEKLLKTLLNKNIIDFRVERTIQALQLRNPIYRFTSRFGHFGVTVTSMSQDVEGKIKTTQLYPWESLDLKLKILEALN